MNIGIIGGQIKDYPLLDHKLNELIEIKGTYLFNIICGPGSLGELWGKKNGSGIQYFLGDFDNFIKKLDFAIVFQDENVQFNLVVKKLTNANVSGTVIIRNE